MNTYPGAIGGFRIMKLKPSGVGPPMMLSIGRQLGRSDFEWKAKKRNTMVCGKGNEHPGQRAPVWGCTCIVADTSVRPIGELEAASKVGYRGPLVVVKTAAGEKLSITPDHPILTTRGWIPAKTLRKGDQVIRHPDARQEVTDTHVDDLPTAIGELHSALSQRRRLYQLRKRVHGLDFHGDGHFMEGDVDVVTVDSLLSGQRDPALYEHVPQGALLEITTRPFQGSRAGARGRAVGAALAGVIASRPNPDTEPVPYPVPQSPVRDPHLFSQLADGLGGQIALDERIEISDRLQPRPRLAARNPSPLEVLADDAVVDAITLTDLRQSLAAPVTLDHVVKVEIIGEWSGHVYDLQTSSGMYSAGNIIIHNCGFWFYKKMDDLRQRVPPAVYGIKEGAYVLLAGWGKVVEHEEGVRTEFARPMGILDENPTAGNAQGMSDEKWRRWISLIGLPVIAPDEIDIAAQMYGLRMLEYMNPREVVQVIFHDGRMIFADADVARTLPHDGVILNPSKLHHSLSKVFGWELEARFHIDDMGRSQKWFGIKNAPHDIMLHNQAQIERMLRSPDAALRHPRG